MKNNTLFCGKQLTIGDKHDPLLPKLLKAINHATEIEFTVSFIQQSGLALLFDALSEALQRKVNLKILVSDYLTITSPIALRELKTLQERGAKTKLFHCLQGKSFHMKSYIFVKTVHGDTSEGCAFVGSNNISKTALTHAHEWCFRHDFSLPKNSTAALEFEYIRQQFDLIFNHQQSQDLNNKLINHYNQRYIKAREQRKLVLVDEQYSVEELEPATPNSIQELALTALAETRKAGFKRGLVVLATGMGKTWLSAFDVMQTQAQTQAKNVLFVAHREEILQQAEQTFIKLFGSNKLFDNSFENSSTGFYNSEKKEHNCQYLFA
ncbi:MAG: DEAD/DEAH box helicase family protein, partial [Colwellia sp.]|nr:DEAD/DEAH box helicase family protein [Colwellia sp.]